MRRTTKILLLAVVASGVVAWWRLREDGVPEPTVARDLLVRARFDLDGCPKDKPISVSVRNGAPRPLRELRFHIEVYADGFSRDLNEGEISSAWDLIVEPRREAELCYGASFGRSRGPFRLNATALSASWYRAGEFIPR